MSVVNQYLWRSGLCQRSVELPLSIFAEMDFFSMPPHWTNRPSAIPEAWHVLCETGWGVTWFEPDSFCCQSVKRLWSSTVGEDIISRSVASGVKKMQYLPTDLGPVFQRCLHHDLNKHRYKEDRYPQGLYASQVGDAVFLVALESFLSLAHSK